MFKFTWLLCFYSLIFELGNVTTAASSNRHFVKVSSLKTAYSEPTTNVGIAMVSLVIRGEGSFKWITENEGDFKNIIVSIVSIHMKNSEQTYLVPGSGDIDIYAVDHAGERTGSAFTIHYPGYTRNTYFSGQFIGLAIMEHSDIFYKVNCSLSKISFGPIKLTGKNAFADVWNARYWYTSTTSTPTTSTNYRTYPTTKKTSVSSVQTTKPKTTKFTEMTTLLTMTESTVQTTTELTTLKDPYKTTTSPTTTFQQIIQTQTTTSKTTQNTVSTPQTKAPTPNLSTQTIWGSVNMVLITSVAAICLFLIFVTVMCGIRLFHRELEMIHKATDIQMISFNLNKHELTA